MGKLPGKSIRNNLTIVHALNSFTDSESRWGDVIKRGVSDDELREIIGFELGIGGFAASPLYADYHGGKNPYVLVKTGIWDEGRKFQGKELLKRARKIFGITKRRFKICPR